MASPLASDTVGPAGRPRLVLVHGFAQTRRCWGPAVEALAADHEVVVVDAPGHGGSAAVDVPFEEAAALLGRVGGPATYVGYSMGGRLCLALALDQPDLVTGLVLIGASPGLANPAERAARRAADDALADRIEAIGVPAFLDEWLALPLFAGLDDGTRFTAERATNTAAGLASSLRRAGTGAQPDLWPRLPHLAVPTLAITGAGDTKFTAIAAAMAASAPPGRIEHRIVAGAGHSVHLEQPAAFVAEVRSWLESRTDL